MIQILILPLSFIGLWISVYFTGVYYKWFSPGVFWVPQVCQLNEKSCLNVLQTPRAKIFGVPNSLFGIFVYSYLLLLSAHFSPWIAFALLASALGRSLYLAYSLIFVTKIPCTLCFCTHAINLVLFSVFAYRVFHQG